MGGGTRYRFAALLLSLGLAGAVVGRGADESRRAEVGVSRVAAGGRHTLVIAADGTVWAWGVNSSGQLGDGTLTNRCWPVQVAGLTGVVGVAAGSTHSLAVKADGTVWVSGNDSTVILGGVYRTPSQVRGLTGMVGVAAATQHSLALKSDGTVWAWGMNSSGQLGDGTTLQKNAPVQVSGLSGVVAVAAGRSHSLALKNDGTVWAWGTNYSGQLGDGSRADRTVPVQVSGVAGVVALAGGYNHSLALKSDGTVWAWGMFDSALLGGVPTRLGMPVVVGGLTDVVSIAAGDSRSVAVKSDGTAWAWGRNTLGELGNGTHTDSGLPVRVGGLTEAASAALGDNFGVAVMRDGNLWSWGDNSYCQLGAGWEARLQLAGTSKGISDVTALGAAGGHALALKRDGTVWGWGLNAFGQVGSDGGSYVVTPLQTAGLSGVSAVAGGSMHSAALRRDGTVWVWGMNSAGQLAISPATSSSSRPLRVNELTGITAIACGSNHVLALRSDGVLWGWGENTRGQVGDGKATNRSTPGEVSGLSGVVAVSGGGAHSVALKSDGTVWAWGYNERGQVGDGTNLVRLSPVQVSGLTGVVAVAAGESHNLALKRDGTVWAWGLGLQGQLGDGTNLNRSRPVQVSGLTGVAAISAGGAHSLALRVDGTVWGWGSNTFGQLGDGTLKDRSTAVQAGGLTEIASVSAGNTFSLAVRVDGVVSAWGGNSTGQLADGNIGHTATPAPVVQLGAPDLAIVKSHSGVFAAGGPGTYSISVTNVGRSETSGVVTVTDLFPPGLSNPSGSGDNWSCSVTGRTGTCTNPGPIQPGATSIITWRLDVGAEAYPGVTNIATVANGSDRVITNNTSGDPLILGDGQCTYAVTPASATIPSGGGSAAFAVQTAAGCAWSVTNPTSWLTVSSTNNGIGPGSVALAAAANPGAARTGGAVIAGVPVTVTQAAGACSYSLSASSQAVGASGGTGSVDVVTGTACQWTATSGAAWVSITSAASGSGNGRVTYQVGANGAGAARSANLTIAGLAYTVQQSGALPGNAVFAGALPQVASGGGWKTTFTIANTGGSAAAIRLNFWGNDGKELVLPLGFPQLADGALVHLASLDRTIEAGATLIVESEGSPVGDVRVGWAELLSTGTVAGLAVFRQRAGDGREQEAAVPLESRTASGYLLQFDNSAGYATGIAVANHTQTLVALTVIQRDDGGREIGSVNLQLAGKGHDSFDLKAKWPLLANRRGTIEVRGPAAGGFSILGLRFHPQGPFTTLPVTGR